MATWTWQAYLIQPLCQGCPAGPRVSLVGVKNEWGTHGDKRKETHRNTNTETRAQEEGRSTKMRNLGDTLVIQFRDHGQGLGNSPIIRSHIPHSRTLHTHGSHLYMLTARSLHTGALRSLFGQLSRAAWSCVSLSPRPPGSPSPLSSLPGLAGEGPGHTARRGREAPTPHHSPGMR